MVVNEQFPMLMPTLYPGSKATDPRTYASLDAMWGAFNDLSHNKTPAVNVEKLFIYLLFRRERGPPPRRGPAGHGCGQGPVPSLLPSWRTGSSHNPIVMSIPDPTDPWLVKMSIC